MQHLLRRKIKILGFAIFFLPLAGVSQLREKINLPDHDEKFIRFGINLGMNRSHFSLYQCKNVKPPVNIARSIRVNCIEISPLVRYLFQNN